jgi:hypothetical protein
MLFKQLSRIFLLLNIFSIPSLFCINPNTAACVEQSHTVPYYLKISLSDFPLALQGHLIHFFGAGNERIMGKRVPKENWPKWLIPVPVSVDNDVYIAKTGWFKRSVIVKGSSAEVFYLGEGGEGAVWRIKFDDGYSFLVKEYKSPVGSSKDSMLMYDYRRLLHNSGEKERAGLHVKRILDIGGPFTVMEDEIYGMPADMFLLTIQERDRQIEFTKYMCNKIRALGRIFFGSLYTRVNIVIVVASLKDEKLVSSKIVLQDFAEIEQLDKIYTGKNTRITNVWLNIYVSDPTTGRETNYPIRAQNILVRFDGSLELFDPV